jgi:hypothetical protein
MPHHHRLLPFGPHLFAGAILVAIIAPAFAQEEEPSEAKPSWDLSQPCENVQHPYEADLCQQWRAAQAAEQTAEAAKKSAVAAEHTAKMTGILTLVGAIAAGLLLVMFIPLIAAASAARKAARSAAQTKPAHRSGRREDEVRAYVDVDKLEFIETPESEGVVRVKVVFRNTGQTPAFDTRSSTKVDIKDVLAEADVPVMPMPDRAADSARPRLGRDATTTDIVECASTPSLADRVMNGQATVVVWGFAEYTDVFDVKRNTKFQYLCNAETLDTGQIFKPMIRGDEGV